MASSNIIKEFLVAIGFKIDNQTLTRFSSTIEQATKLLAIFTSAAEAAGVGVTTAIGSIANSMEQLYFASKRTGAAVENIQAFAFAAGQMGSSAQSAQSSLESFAHFLQSSPGAINVVRSLGVTANDTSQMLMQLGEAFQHMPFYRALAYGQLMGLDYRTIIALTSGLGEFTEQFKKLYRAAGIDGEQGAKASHLFMNEIRETVKALEILAQKVEIDLVSSVGGDIRKFREAIIKNFGPISQIIEVVIKGIVFLADAATRMAVRFIEVLRGLYDWFSQLDDRTKSFLETIGGLVVAWKLLNSAFLTSPIGMLITAFVTLLALLDDYKTWKEGGKSLIDWTKWEPAIKQFQKGLHDVGDGISYIADNVGHLDHAVELLIATLLGTRLLRALGVFKLIQWITGIGGGAAAAGGAAAGGRGVGAAIGAGAARAGGILRWLGPIGAFLYGMWPSEANPAGDDPVARGTHPGPPGTPQGPYTPQGAAGGGGAGASLTGTARQAMQFFLSRGYSLAQAAGIVANLQAESGSFNPREVGDRGQAYGIAQWHPERQNKIAAQFGKPLSQMSFEEQLAALDWELHQQQYSGANTGSNAYDFGRNTSLVYEGAGGVSGDPSTEAGRRGMLAQQLYNESLGAGYGQGAPGGGGGGGGVVINQQTDISVHGTGDPFATADRVAQVQRGVNADLVRNMQGVVR